MPMTINKTITPSLRSYTEVYSDVHCECRVPGWKRLTTVTNFTIAVLISYALIFGDETEIS